jgi:hypothetical protein
MSNFQSYTLQTGEGQNITTDDGLVKQNNLKRALLTSGYLFHTATKILQTIS